MSNHTPGPWYVAYRHYGGGKTADRIVADSGELICEGLSWNDNGEVDGQLIAAAPDLLAACEWARIELGKHTRPSPLDAAIAKATNHPTP